MTLTTELDDWECEQEEIDNDTVVGVLVGECSVILVEGRGHAVETSGP